MLQRGPGDPPKRDSPGPGLPKWSRKGGKTGRSADREQVNSITSRQEAPAQARRKLLLVPQAPAPAGQIAFAEGEPFPINRKQIGSSFLLFPILYLMYIGKCFLSWGTPGLSQNRSEVLLTGSALAVLMTDLYRDQQFLSSTDNLMLGQRGSRWSQRLTDVLCF